ncbi:MAG: hypothetical protein ABI672_04980 [Vicinamibacteria bacterium]
MDTLIVVFTGLMIFDFQGHRVYPIPAPNHDLRVQIGSATSIPVTKSIVFEDLETGDSDPVIGFYLLSLPKLASVTTLTLKPSTTRDTISLHFLGELIPFGARDICRLDTQPGLLSWEGAQWNVKIKPMKVPTIVLDGTKRILLTNLPTVTISNEYPMASSGHFDSYKLGVNESVAIAECKPRDGRLHNPVTCPPVSLK